MANSKIPVTNINLGGMANSKYQGLENSVATIVGLNIHEEPGVIKVNQKLTKDSGTTIDDFVKKLLPCSDGNVYAFGSTSGKVWKRSALGVWTAEVIIAPGAGTAGVKDAFEDQGYIYYVTQSRIGRVAVGSAWTTRNDNWATLTNGDADFHPCQSVNLVNYIGDGNLVSQVEDGVFTADALDIKKPLRVRSLGIFDTALLIGSYVADNINVTEIFNWNTWSVSFSNSDPIPEKGINAFLKIDNACYANAGEKGNIYAFDGGALRKVKRIPGDWSIGKKAIVHSDATAEFNIPLFGLSNLANNPCLMGVYGLGCYSADYSPVLSLEYVISQNKTASIEIGSILVIDDYALVSWKDGTTYGVDRIDSTLKYDGAYFETRLMFPDRGAQTKIQKVKVPYRLLPDGCDIEIWQSINYGDYAKMETTKDNLRKFIETSVDIQGMVTCQFKVVLRTSENLAPEIEGLEINI